MDRRSLEGPEPINSGIKQSTETMPDFNVNNRGDKKRIAERKVNIGPPPDTRSTLRGFHRTRHLSVDGIWAGRWRDGCCRKLSRRRKSAPSIAHLARQRPRDKALTRCAILMGDKARNGPSSPSVDGVT
ncbi:unnamed protein product, partial [Iphiclides podalirius]